VGLILGDYVAGGVWALIGLLTGEQMFSTFMN